jgi:hypothetical protein
MASLRQLPDEALRQIALQIGGRLYAAFSPVAVIEPTPLVDGIDIPSDFAPIHGIAELATARYEIAESLQIWKLAANVLDEFALSQGDLVTLARPTGGYHHQVKATAASPGSPTTAVAFANSWQTGSGPTDWSVRDVFFSPLAAKIDEAIASADNLVPEEADTRLLSLPEYQLEAIWFVILSEDKTTRDVTVRRATSKVIVVEAPNSFKESKMSLLNSTDFLRALVGTRTGMGFIT